MKKLILKGIILKKIIKTAAVLLLAGAVIPSLPFGGGILGKLKTLISPAKVKPVVGCWDCTAAVGAFLPSGGDRTFTLVFADNGDLTGYVNEDGVITERLKAEYALDGSNLSLFLDDGVTGCTWKTENGCLVLTFGDTSVTLPRAERAGAPAPAQTAELSAAAREEAVPQP